MKARKPACFILLVIGRLAVITGQISLTGINQDPVREKLAPYKDIIFKIRPVGEVDLRQARDVSDADRQMDDGATNSAADLGFNQRKADDILIIAHRTAVFTDQPESHPGVALATIANSDVKWRDRTFRTHIACGVVEIKKGATADEALETADTAMYKVKKGK